MLTALPAFAMGTHKRTFAEDCDTVWQASMQVAKSSQYQIVSVSKEEHIISVQPGGFFWGGNLMGERTVTLSLEPAEHGCTATAKSHYSGIQHADDSDLLARVHVQLVGLEVGTEVPPFGNTSGVENYNSSEPKCEAKLRRRLAKASKP